MSAPVPAIEVLRPDQAEAAQRRAAGALAARGLGRGDRVAFCLPSSAAVLVCVLGALRSGIVPVLLNATLLPAERDALLADADPGVVVLDDAELEDLVHGPAADLAPWPLARPMHYTSGTTGRPKGVWSGVLTPDDARALFEDEVRQWGFGPHDVHLVCSPMYHSVSVRFAGATLLSGGTVVILPRFDAALARAALDTYRPTTTFLAPTALARLLALDDPPVDLRSLRLLAHAGSPCPPRVKQAAIDRTGAGVVWEFYGATEGQFTACSPEEWCARPGTVGRARAGRRLAVDGDGLVWCRAPRFARFEYWRDPEATDRAWRGDAFTVGDLGRLDADGYLYLDGRRDDLVITGGVNVYPAEVEAVLGEAPGVSAVAVFGVPDAEWGERVCAAVVGEADEEALRAHAASHLAPYKRPKSYVFVETLPYTPTGKLRRGALAGLLGLAVPDGGEGRVIAP